MQAFPFKNNVTLILLEEVLPHLPDRCAVEPPCSWPNSGGGSRPSAAVSLAGGAGHPSLENGG